MSKQLFNTLAHYAIRSLERHPTRSLLTVSIVVVAVAVTNIVMRYTAAVMTVLEQGAWDTGLGHAQLHAKGYATKEEGVSIQDTLSEDDSVGQRLIKSPELEASARRIRFEGVASNGQKSVYFIGIGVEPEAELKVSPRLFSSNDQGAFISGDDPRGVVIGEGLAATLNLTVGSEMTLVSQTLEGSQNGVDVVVRGIVNVPLPSFSKRTVYVPYKVVQELLRMPGRYTELAFRFTTPEVVDRWIAANAADAEGVGQLLRAWWQIQPMIKIIEKIWNGIISLVTSMLFGLAGIAVANMILVVVNERTIEIGTLRAIGARRSFILRLFTAESLLIGTVGGVLGTVIAIVITLVMGRVGVPFDNPFGSAQIVVYPALHVAQMAMVFSLGLAICLVAAVWPSRKASRVEPVRAFRGQIT